MSHLLNHIDPVMGFAIVNGPNLNLLGVREPSIYGPQSFDSFIDGLRSEFPSVPLSYYQSNHEGAIIDYIQQVGFTAKGVVINAGGYSHTSVAIRDAILAVPAPFVEVHISNIFARDSFRQHSLISDVCKGVIIGLGLDGYRLAINHLLHLSS